MMSYLLNFLVQLECLQKIRHYKLEDTFHGLSWNFSPLLLYGSQIWGQSNQSVSKKEKLQNKALRINNFKTTKISGKLFI